MASNGWEINLHPNLRRRFGGSVMRCQKYCDEHKIPIHELNNAYFQAARRFVPTGNGGHHKRPPDRAFHKLGR